MIDAKPLAAETYPIIVPEALAKGAQQHNPSVVVWQGGLWACVRLLDMPEATTRNVLGRISDDWGLIDPRLADVGDSKASYEDCRLFVMGDALMACATINGATAPRVAILTFDDPGDDTVDVTAAVTIPSNLPEKNWMPFVDESGLRLVYSIDPTVVMAYDARKKEVTPRPADIGERGIQIRGGSQLVPYEGGYVCVTHEVARMPSEPTGSGGPANRRRRARHALGGPCYLHRFVHLDARLHVVRMSQPFYFKQLGIEFCAGLARWRDQIVIAFGVGDKEAHIAVTNEDMITQMLSQGVMPSQGDLSQRHMRVLGGVPATRPLVTDSITPIHADPKALEGLRGPWWHNPSVAVHKGELRVIVRAFEPALNTTHNVIGTLSPSWQIEGAHRVRDRTSGPREPRGMTRGFEDVRLFVHDGKLMGSASACDRLPGTIGPQISILEFNDDGDIIAAHVQPSPRHEKNWMPVPGAPLRFMYTVDPSVALTYDGQSHRVVPSPSMFGVKPSTARGGSQIIPYDDGYLGVIHEVSMVGARGVYSHRFVRFDRTMRAVRTSEPFYFQEPRGIEFCAGIELWQGKYVLSYGTGDKQASIAVVDPTVVDRMVGGDKGQ